MLRYEAELEEGVKLMGIIKRSEEIIKRPIKNKDIGEFRKERILAHPLLLKKEKKLLCLIDGGAMST